MNIKRLIVFVAVFLSCKLTAAESIAEKDLALIFPIDETNLILTTDFSANATPFPEEWYDAAMDGFLPTVVGNALYNENYFSDWAMVSLRFVPCSTFQLHVSEENDELCWR